MLAGLNVSCYKDIYFKIELHFNTIFAMFSTGSFRFGGHFWRGSTCGAQSKSATPMGVFAAIQDKLLSAAQGDEKICSISQKQVCFVSAVAEGLFMKFVFQWNEM